MLWKIFRRFGSRAGVGFLLVYQAIFLNVIVPGHIRGAIPIVGQSSTPTLNELCCCCCCQTKESANSKQSPTPKNPANCAICNLAAHYTPPPVFDVRLNVLGLLEVAPPPQILNIAEAEFYPTYYACGPPPSSSSFRYI